MSVDDCVPKKKLPSCSDSFRNVLEDHHVPKNGRYRGVLVEDSAEGKMYFYDSCGVFVELVAGDPTEPPVLSVNGKVGHVVLDYGDVGAVGIDTIFINIKDHGALGNSVHDDTANIQAALDLAAVSGAIVWVPYGDPTDHSKFYKITNRLVVASGVHIMGPGRHTTGVGEAADGGPIIKQTVNNKDGIFALDAVGVQLEGFTLLGPGAGTGIGINFDWALNGNNMFHHFRNLTVRAFGNTGLKMRTACVSRFDNVLSSNNGNHGFEWPEGGTSCTFTSCWARTNAKAGYRFVESVYMNLSGCAADFNGISYEIVDAQSIGFYSCGSEFASKNGIPYDGTSWKIDNSALVSLWSCWVVGNNNVAIDVVNTAQGAYLDVADNSPGGSAVYFIKTQAGTLVNIAHMYNSSPNSLAPGTANILNDGGGSMRPAADLYLRNNQSVVWRNFADDDDKVVLHLGNTDDVVLRGGGGDVFIEADDGSFLAQFREDGTGLDMRDHKIIALTDPSADQDAVNLQYARAHFSERVAVPATAASPGTPGQIAMAPGFFYTCVGVNQWERVATATW